MNNAIDLIFLALVAGFLIYRLRSVLGSRTGNERRPNEAAEEFSLENTPSEESLSSDNVVPLPSRTIDPAISTAFDESVEAGLTQIKMADRSFEPERFLVGAQTAFAMIVEAFAKGDRETLRPLLADDVFGGFDAAIAKREADSRTMKTEIAGFQRLSIVGATLRDHVAAVTVRFVSEQITALYDTENRIVEGDPTEAHRIIDDWTFARDTRSSNPNWQLVATAVPDLEES